MSVACADFIWPKLMNLIHDTLLNCCLYCLVCFSLYFWLMLIIQSKGFEWLSRELLSWNMVARLEERGWLRGSCEEGGEQKRLWRRSWGQQKRSFICTKSKAEVWCSAFNTGAYLNAITQLRHGRQTEEKVGGIRERQYVHASWPLLNVNAWTNDFRLCANIYVEANWIFQW